MYILAEHHNLMARALLELETLAGSDMSDDRASLDFRLRDLDDKCLENDECPEGVLHVEEQLDECFRVRVITYKAEISGNAETVEIDFGDGTKTTELEGVHEYPLGVNFEPRLSVANKNCISENTPEIEIELDVVTGPPSLVCPDITCPPPSAPILPPVPAPVPPPFVQPPVNLSCPACTTPTILLGSIPTMIFMQTPVFPTMITVTGIKDINVNLQTMTVSIVHTFIITGPTAEGPCFALVPCGTGPTGTVAT